MWLEHNCLVTNGQYLNRNTTFQQAEAPSSGGSVAPSSVTAPTTATAPAPSPPPLQPPWKETGFGFYTMSQPADVYITEPVHNINVKSDPYDLSKVLMLDSGSTCHMGNKHIHGTRETTNRPINVTTSNGSSLHDQVVKIDGLGDVYVNEDGPANIISLPKLVQSGMYRITFDTDADNAFNIYSKATGKLINRFTQDHRGMYTKPIPEALQSPTPTDEACHLLDTLDENQIGFTIRGNVVIEYCPTDQMMGDYMTKPLQGRIFNRWRDAIMNSGYSMTN